MNSMPGSILKTGCLFSSDIFSVGGDSTSGSIENESANGLASFAPYFIEEKNVELLNNLFQEETLWKDLNDSHKLGAALEHESVPGDSIANHTVTSSLSDFWEVMNQRYVYSENQSTRDGRPSSITRNKLLSATHQSRLLNSAYNSQRNQQISSLSRNRMKMKTSEGRITHSSSPHYFPSPSSTKGSHLLRRDYEPNSSPSKNIQLKPFQLRQPSSTLPPPNAIVPDYLVHLDPLSVSVTTTLKGLSKLEGDHIKSKRKFSSQSEISGDITEWNQRDRTTSHDGTILSIDDHTHVTNNSWGDDESAIIGGGDPNRNRYFTKNDKRFQHKHKIPAEKLKDMTFMKNFFLQKATLADTHDLILRMQVCYFIICHFPSLPS